jgi:phosphate transport system permease protein
LTNASAPEPQRKTFTGITRRATRRSVKVTDAVAKYVITIGGVGVVVCFAAIIGFLCYVVVPLFKPAQIDLNLATALPAAAPTTAPAAAGTPLAMQVDEYLKSFWLLDDRGQLSIYRTAAAELVRTEALSDVPVTAVSDDKGVVALGRADGTVRAGRIKQEMEFVGHLPDAMEGLKDGESAIHDGGVAMMTPAGPRVVRTVADLSEPIAVTTDRPTPVRLVDFLFTDRLEVMAAYLDDGRLFYNVISKRPNVMTGKVRRTISTHELPAPAYKAGERPVSMLLGLNGRLVFVIYADGHCLRYNTHTPAEAYIAEEIDLLPAADATVTKVKMLLGARTLIVADSAGGVAGWFPAPFPHHEEAKTRDREHMMLAHALTAQGAAVTTVAVSERDRQFITGDAKGTVLLRHMTSGTTQGKMATKGEAAIGLLAMSPKNDAVLMLDAQRQVALYSMHNPHADGSMSALFLPIHYEGYPEPTQVWQSSSGTDDAEAKFSLMPLVFGTAKATIYAMLFGVPIAILAAIYSSEFMQPQVRAVVKPVVEMMASLPSVVLGFIAALVLAPFVEQVLPAVLATFVAIPVGVMLFGFIWQGLPPQTTRSLPGWVPFATMLVLVVVSLWLSFQVGPTVERILFFGDFRGWVGYQANRAVPGAAVNPFASAVPGWVVLLAPLFSVALVMLFNLYVRRHVPLYNYGTSRAKLTIADLVRFALTAAVSIGLAYAVGVLFNAIGWDLRGGPIGPYVQRNTLIVGMIMGFAIIPIIYTVSEDALSSVPASLRSAALGAGATPWQTAIRVVLPVAISGIFSACMIGFGRAAGETMIVLMAGGNTAILDPNIFTGVRPMSANIAVELPEAPVNSTHYRVLFLSAVVLFVITFCVNTAAETIRIRFRKRAYQL